MQVISAMTGNLPLVYHLAVHFTCIYVAKFRVEISKDKTKTPFTLVLLVVIL